MHCIGYCSPQHVRLPDYPIIIKESNMYLTNVFNMKQSRVFFPNLALGDECF